jgi:hypothetical protein
MTNDVFKTIHLNAALTTGKQKQGSYNSIFDHYFDVRNQNK